MVTQSAVAVQRPLGRLLREKPAQRHEVPALLVDAALGDAEDLRDPGGLDAALGVAHAAFVEEAADEVAEDGGDERAAGAARDEADDSPRDGHPSVVVGDEIQGRLERLGLEAKLPRVGGELDARLRDLAQQADGQELVDGLALPPAPPTSLRISRGVNSGGGSSSVQPQRRLFISARAK